MLETNILKLFKNEYLLISLSCYGLGLIYNYLGYLYFEVPILYYVTLTDLLFYTVLQLISITLILALFIFIYIPYLSNKLIKKYTEDSSNFNYYMFQNSITPLTFLSFAGTFYIHFYSIGNYFIIFVTIPVLMIFIANKYATKSTRSFVNIFSYFMILLLGISFYGNKQVLMETKNREYVEFIYEKRKKVQTDSYNFIWEKLLPTYFFTIPS